MFSVTDCVNSGPEVTIGLFTGHVELYVGAGVDCEIGKWRLATLSLSVPACATPHMAHSVHTQIHTVS